MTAHRTHLLRSYAPLFLGFLLTGMVTTVLGPVLPSLVTTWRLSYAQAGALFTAQFLGALSAGALTGLMTSALGVRQTLTLGYLLMSAGLIALCAGAYPAGFAGACATGLGMGCVIPTSNVIVAGINPDRAASALGALNLSWGIGAAMWPLVVAFTVRIADARAALIFLMLLNAAAGVIIYSFSTPFQPAPRATASRRAAVPWRLGLFGVVLLLYTGIETAIGGWLPEYARRLRLAASPADWAAMGTAFWGGLSAGRGIVALRLDRRFEGPAVIAGLTIVTGSLLVLLNAHDGSVIRGSAVVSGLGLGPIFPITAAALSREAPMRIAGPLIALGSLGAAIVPWLVGIVSDRAGALNPGIALLVVAMIALTILHVLRLATGPREAR